MPKLLPAIIFVLIFSVAGLLVFSAPPDRFAQQRPALQAALAELRQERAKDPVSPAVRDLLQEIDQTFRPADWVSEIPSPDMGSPTPERLDRINQIAATLEPYQLLLVELAYDKRLGDEGARMSNLLLYASPSASLKQALLRGADENAVGYYTLFNLGLFDQEVRAQYVKGLVDSASPELRRGRALMATTWGLVEVLPVYREMLQQPFDPKTISFVGDVPAENSGSILHDYGLAATAAMYLGPAGKELLPLIKQRLADVQTAFPNKGLVLTGKFIGPIDVIEGRRRPPVAAAMNGRGVLSLMTGPPP